MSADKLKAEVKELKALVKELSHHTSSSAACTPGLPVTVVVESVSTVMDGSAYTNSLTSYLIDCKVAYELVTLPSAKVTLPATSTSSVGSIAPTTGTNIWTVPQLINLIADKIALACQYKQDLEWLIAQAAAGSDADLTARVYANYKTNLSFASDAICANERALCILRQCAPCLTPCKVDCKCH